MKLKRIITALLGFPFVAGLLIYGNKYMVDIAFSIVSILAIREYFHAFDRKANPVRWVGYIAAAFIAFMHIIPMNFVLMTIGISVPLVISVLFIQIIITGMKTTVNDITITLFGICYIIGFILYIPMLHGMENGKFLIWYIFLAAWGTDVFAYFVGVKYGKHKFTKVSPKKSIEGSIGGIIGATIVSLIYTIIINKYANINISYWYIAIVVPLLSIFSQVGDLAASSIKRYVEIKDYSELLPGHGGMLDTIDSIIFIAPFAYFLLGDLINRLM